MTSFLRRLLVLSSCLVAGTALAERPRVVTLRVTPSDTLSSVAAGFAAEVDADVTHLVISGAGSTALVHQRAVAALADVKKSASLVLALGPVAAAAAKQVVSEVPVVFSMVPNYERYDLLGQPNITGVSLTSNFESELELIKALLPEARRVGVIFNPRYSGRQIEGMEAIAKRLSLTLVEIEVDSLTKAERATRGLKNRVDVMVMVADATVGDASFAHQLVESCLDDRIPLVGVGAATVADGALMSVTPTPIAIGQQAGRLANRIVHEKVDPGAIAVSQPEGYEIHVNVSTVNRLGEGVEFWQDLATYTARKHLSVRVVESP